MGGGEGGLQIWIPPWAADWLAKPLYAPHNAMVFLQAAITVA